MSREFLQGVAVVAQRSPTRNPGGDCFAASVLAGMRFLFGDRAPSYDQCWEAFQFEQKNPDGSTSTHLRNVWPGMRDALYKLYGEGWKLEILADAVMPQMGSPEEHNFNWGPRVDGYDYARRLEGWLRQGYVAIGDLMMHGCETGEWTIRDGQPSRNANDHFLIYDGVRSGWRKHSVVSGASTLVYQIHVVCSSKGGRAYWIDVDDLLRKHGAGSWWLFREYERGDLPEAA